MYIATRRNCMLEGPFNVCHWLSVLFDFCRQKWEELEVKSCSRERPTDLQDMATSSHFRVRPYNLKKSRSRLPMLPSRGGLLSIEVGILEGCCSRNEATITRRAYDPMPPWYTYRKAITAFKTRPSYTKVLLQDVRGLLYSLRRWAW